MLSPNVGGTLRNPRFLVVHHTASGTLESAVNWLCNPKARASAHAVIGRDGTTEQLVPFDRVAWACGPSVWRDVKGLNSHSISLELVAWGPLKRADDGTYRSVVGNVAVPDSEVAHGKHKSGLFSYEHWHVYTSQQIAALDKLASELFTQFPSLVEIVGHDDISVGRKCDPGFAAESLLLDLQRKLNRR